MATEYKRQTNSIMKQQVSAVFSTASASVLPAATFRESSGNTELIHALTAQVKKHANKAKRKALRLLVVAFSPHYEQTQNRVCYGICGAAVLYFVGGTLLRIGGVL